MSNRIGVCCLILGDGATKFKTLQLKRTQAEANPKQKIFEVYKHNLSELVKAIDYLIKQKIWHYRISSNMFPLADHPDFGSYWDLFCCYDSLWIPARMAIKKYLDLGGRVSVHPDQFCIISSKDEETNKKGIINLEYHGKMFDMLNIPQSYFCPINIHVSNGNWGMQAANVTFDNLKKLSYSVISRLVFETEDKSYWTWQKLRYYFPHIPVTLDYHHRSINNEGETEQEAHDACVKSWGNTIPLFHYSEGREHALDRAHSDYVVSIPTYGNVDIELEAKQKNLAVLRLRV